MQRLLGGVVAAKHGEDCNVVHAFGLPLGTETPPGDIQLFPPGKHRIVPFLNGEPTQMEVEITEATANAIRADFEAYLKAAEEGTGPRPHIDFNHECAEAAGWVTDVFWAGSDPKTGGIRAKIAWSKPGADAIVGAAYRQFSPNFRVAPKGKREIIGTVPNMGGLVNTPAFRAIQPLFAADGGAAQHKQSMNKLLQALLAAGLVTAIHADEDAAVADFAKSFDGFKAKQADALKTANDNTAKALDGEKAAKAKVDELTGIVAAKDAKLKEFALASAKATVAAAVQNGVIAAKDAQGQELWTARIAERPEDAALLGVVVSARAATGGVDPTKAVVTATGGDAGRVVTGFDALVAKAKEANPKLTDSEAAVAVARTNPDAYDAYRASLMKRG